MDWLLAAAGVDVLDVVDVVVGVWRLESEKNAGSVARTGKRNPGTESAHEQ